MQEREWVLEETGHAYPCTKLHSDVCQLTKSEEFKRTKLTYGEEWERKFMFAIIQWELDVKQSRYEYRNCNADQ